jgi:hypothetical protein
MNSMIIQKRAWKFLLPLLGVILTILACDSTSIFPKAADTATEEATPTQTPSPTGLATVIVENANLRSGPGASYPVVGVAKKGDKFFVYGQNEDGSWLQVDSAGTSWIKASLVEPFQGGDSTKTADTEGLLPGLQPADVKAGLENLEFTCEAVYTPSESEPYFKWECQRESAAYSMLVEVWSKSMSTVDVIKAGVQQSGEPDDALSVEILGFVAATLYEGAEPAKAQAWVEKTLPTIKQEGDVREAKFGGIRFRLSGAPAARFLTIGEDLPRP